MRENFVLACLSLPENAVKLGIFASQLSLCCAENRRCKTSPVKLGCRHMVTGRFDTNPSSKPAQEFRSLKVQFVREKETHRW